MNTKKLQWREYTKKAARQANQHLSASIITRSEEDDWKDLIFGAVVFELGAIAAAVHDIAEHLTSSDDEVVTALNNARGLSAALGAIATDTDKAYEIISKLTGSAAGNEA